jgi:hypothetical protein
MITHPWRTTYMCFYITQHNKGQVLGRILSVHEKCYFKIRFTEEKFSSPWLRSEFGYRRVFYVNVQIYVRHLFTRPLQNADKNDMLSVKRCAHFS